MTDPATRILVVDDDEAVRENLAECLEAEGHDVATAADGFAALERLSRDPLPEVVLLDLSMPGLDGHGLASAIRALPRCRALRLVLITGHTGLAPGATAAVDGVLHKPFSVDELLAVLHAAPRDG